MTWIDYPAIDNTDWTDISWYSQLSSAILEKYSVFGDPSFYSYLVPSVGGIAGGGTGDTSLAHYQYVCQSLSTGFLATIDSTSNRITDFDNIGGLDPFEYWTWDKIKNRVLGHDWTRKYPDGAGGTAVGYGGIQVGDYIGPWIFNELRAVLDEFVWTHARIGSGDSSSVRYSGRNEDYTGNYYEDTWAAAKAAAENDYSGPVSTGFSAIKNASGYQLNSDDWRAWLESRIIDVPVSLVSVGLACEIDFYAFTVGTPYSGVDFTYDDNGLGVYEDKWGLFTTESASESDTSATGILGNSDMPNWPTAPSYQVQSGRGFYLGTDSGLSGDPFAAVKRYDVPGGMTYLRSD